MPAAARVEASSLNRLAASATTHCLTGCAIGEVLGLVIATALGWGTAASILLAVALAFVFGYALTMRPLLAAGMDLGAAAGLALAADTVSIGVMEIVDNAVMLLIPGAMAAGLADPLFWGSLALALGLAWIAAYPVNRWLIARGRGHAVVHGRHRGGPSHDGRRTRHPVRRDHEREPRAGDRPAGDVGPPHRVGAGRGRGLVQRVRVRVRARRPERSRGLQRPRQPGPRRAGQATPRGCWGSKASGGSCAREWRRTSSRSPATP
ncbi:MAG: DUF4396 domain-containing protein [Gemmatimonadetes bacterium]|nr:DUF4396 domain-containing protein [Gemmatimonadota bacterium]